MCIQYWLPVNPLPIIVTDIFVLGLSIIPLRTYIYVIGSQRLRVVFNPSIGQLISIFTTDVDTLQLNFLALATTENLTAGTSRAKVRNASYCFW